MDYEFQFAKQQARAKLVFDELTNGLGSIKENFLRRSRMTPLERFTYDTLQSERAKELIEAMIDGDSPSGDSDSLEDVAKLNQLISENLDADSIWAFAYLAHSVLKGALFSDLDAHDTNLQAREYALKRHAENHAMKADVFNWLDTNMASFKSMDRAAEAVTKQQPIAFRTARDWVGEWKKLRSASTP